MVPFVDLLTVLTKVKSSCGQCNSSGSPPPTSVTWMFVTVAGNAGNAYISGTYVYTRSIYVRTHLVPGTMY